MLLSLNAKVLNEITGLLILPPEKCNNLTHVAVNYHPENDLCVARKHKKEAAEIKYKVNRIFYDIILT